MNRRDFIGGAVATLGGLWLPRRGLAAAEPRRLRVGVVSDVHLRAADIAQYARNSERLERAFRWFDGYGVDAVMVPGDIAHSGFIAELENFAAVWNRVFPNDRGGDGRHVERLFVTGNHDLEAWWVKGEPAWRRERVFNCGDNPRRVWQRLFHEDFQLIWKKTVKGYAFVGAQWPTRDVKPPVEKWFAEHAGELRGTKPFFYIQHNPPKGTCGNGKTSHDDGTATRALAPFANAVAVTGHTHQTITDDSCVWQGAFTSINAGCLQNGDNDRAGAGYDSTYPSYSPKRKLNRMKPLDAGEGGCGVLLDVFDDRIEVRRLCFAGEGEPLSLGADWVLPLPAAAGGAFDPVNQKRASVAPQFAAADRLEVVRCDVAPKEIAGPALAGKPCFWLKIPHPQTLKEGSRVYDFDITVLADGCPKLHRRILANGFNVPEKLAGRVTNCLFGADELPTSGKVEFSVVARNCWGVEGKGLRK